MNVVDAGMLNICFRVCTLRMPVAPAFARLKMSMIETEESFPFVTAEVCASEAGRSPTVCKRSPPEPVVRAQARVALVRCLWNVKYGSRAAELGVPADDLYQALVDTAENTVSPFRTCIFIHGARQLLPCIVPSLLIGMKVRYIYF